jgi:hypothetical protein
MTTTDCSGLAKGFTFSSQAAGSALPFSSKKVFQLAAADDPGFFPFTLGSDVDDGYAGFNQALEFGAIDINNLGLGRYCGQAKAESK